MKRLYGLLIAIVALFVFVPLAAAADNDGDEHPAQRWDQEINTTSRFTVLSAFGSHAVRDNETGLVWEKSPSTSTFAWQDAQTRCNKLTTGGRLGWRLPTLQELTSLVDRTQSFPSLPVGNPFTNINPSLEASFYWSATTSAVTSSNAWEVDFVDGGVDFSFGFKSTPNFVWCVRGGQGVNPQ